MRKTVGDSFLARRDVLKLGGYGLLGAFADQALWPVAARAAGKSNPRGTARFGIVVELAGAISHTDTFDFKENAGTPKDLDVRPVNNNSLYLSHRLLRELDKASAPNREGRDRSFGAFHSFQDAAFGILRDPRWPKAFQISAEERAKYGDNEVGLGCLLARNLIQADAGTRYIHVTHSDWDHHKAIYTHSAKSNHYVRCNEMDRAVANLIRDLGAAPSPRDKSKTLLDETFIAVVSEFGRVPGPLNGIAGRHHYNLAYHALFAGAGAKGGRIIGKTDA